MKRSKILLEKEEERKDDLLEYLETLYYIKDNEEEIIDEFEEEDLIEYLEALSYVERMVRK